MLERARLEVQDIANKAARQVFARQNVRILAAEHVRQIVRREVGGRFKQLDSGIEDLPAGITDPYVFPYLEPGDIQWASLDSAMDWCHRMFAELGLIH